MIATKILAMYLPQYHEIRENDEWWGKGFTEWTNVKKAKPLYNGHLQPEIPYGEDYYDLADRSVLIRQMNLAKEYGIDGFCFYHYWFGGKKLLEKPIEQLLAERDIPLPFCLCWANEAWTRRWDGVSGSDQMLMPQSYGGEKEWCEHFHYLNQFFINEKYIKVRGKPVVFIYKPSEIIQRKEMYMEWNRMAREEGYPGIYIINMRKYIREELPFWGNATADFEPFTSLVRLQPGEWKEMVHTYYGNRSDNKGICYHVLDYSKFCDYMVNKYVARKCNHFLGFFMGWDNTPRRGVNTQRIFENNVPELVEKYFDIQFRRSLDLGNRFLTINAWNEWGEGTHLEPDERYQFGYLEAIRNVKQKYGLF